MHLVPGCGVKDPYVILLCIRSLKIDPNFPDIDGIWVMNKFMN